MDHTKEQFFDIVSTLRLKNKGKWYTWTGTVAGKSVQVKGFNTWLQVFRIDGIDHSNVMDQKPNVFKAWLADTVAKAF